MCFMFCPLKTIKFSTKFTAVLLANVEKYISKSLNLEMSRNAEHWGEADQGVSKTTTMKQTTIYF